MANFVNKGRSHLINGNLLTFALNSLGLAFAVRVQVDYVSSIMNDFVLNGCLVKDTEAASSFMLVDARGGLTAISYRAFSALFDDNSKCLNLIRRLNLSFFNPHIMGEINARRAFDY